MQSSRVITVILMTVVVTLAIVVGSVVFVMLVALFDDRVNNDEIFKLIGPAFNMIVGAFVGLLGGISISRRKDTPPEPPL
jgi:uncharacterized membrane protein YjjP (DUF1212 family)